MYLSRSWEDCLPQDEPSVLWSLYTQTEASTQGSTRSSICRDIFLQSTEHQKWTLINNLSLLHSHQCFHLPWNAHWDGIFWSRSALEEAAEDTVREQRMQAETLRLHKESPTVPKKIQRPVKRQNKSFHLLNLKKGKLLRQNLDKCSPFENVGIITHQLDIRISYFLSLNLLVFLEQSRSWLLIH